MLDSPRPRRCFGSCAWSGVLGLSAASVALPFGSSTGSVVFFFVVKARVSFRLCVAFVSVCVSVSFHVV